MDEKDSKEITAPQVLMHERRAKREHELTSTEVMRILRKRAGLVTRKQPRDEEP